MGSWVSRGGRAAPSRGAGHGLSTRSHEDQQPEQQTTPVEEHGKKSRYLPYSASVPASWRPQEVAAMAAARLGRPASRPTDNVLGKPFLELSDRYNLGRELGHGQFGITRLCTRLSDGRLLACKTIAKRKLVRRGDAEDVRREVQIMEHLAGSSPNIVQLFEALEDKQYVYLVMELCEGGELFDRIVQRGNYSERAAAGLVRTIVRVLDVCHSMGVTHRDLKPENFLFATAAEDSPLKATDFGLSMFFKPGERFTDLVGSAFYVAPEVLRRTYGPEADVWSAGVILYILLSGVPPFWGDTDQAIFDAILRGHLDLTSEPWPKISHGAKHLLKKMLDHDPRERLPLQDVLKHPWLKEDGEAPDDALDDTVLSRMKQFSAMNRLKKMALKVIAERLSEEEIMELKAMFKSMDADNSGTITLDELKAALAKLGPNMAESEVQQLMEAADVDRNGSIDYIEFITVTMQINKMEKEEHLYAAFQYFDKDNSGYITLDELEQALDEHRLQALKEIIQEVDIDQDGRIDYEEFVAMMRKGSAAGGGGGAAASSVVE